jgi:hypothetical protein
MGKVLAGDINAMADASPVNKCCMAKTHQDGFVTYVEDSRRRWPSTYPNEGIRFVSAVLHHVVQNTNALTSVTASTPFSRCGCSLVQQRMRIADDTSILFVLSYTFDRLVDPFMQHFALTNTSLQYPYTNHERIPVYLLIILTGLCPAIIVSIYALLIEDMPFRRPQSTYEKQPAYEWRRRLWEVHSGVLALVTAQGFAYLTVTALKNITGKPRPDLIARCLPRTGASDEVPFGLVSVKVCSQQDHGILKDGWLNY